ncbi:signal peptidase I [Amedibacillus sp. YH-ame10]
MDEEVRFEAEIDIPETTKEQIKKNKKMKPKKEGIAYEIWDLFKTFVICAVFVFLLTTFVVKPVQVEGVSMTPTLENKQIGVMNVIDVKIHGINRFDVVVVSDDKITGGDNWVKRVIGLPGDSIYAKDDVVYVNGQAIDEPYLDTKYVDNFKNKINPVFTGDFEKITLKEGEYFLMGDNRPYSHDSRAVGPFLEGDFKGKDVYVLYPFTEMHIVRNGALS